MFVEAIEHRRPGYVLTRNRITDWLFLLLALKMVQEDTPHGAKWLDNYVATEVVSDWWNYLTGWT